MNRFELAPGECNLELDELSTLTMTYSHEGYEELKKDIKDNGQLVPIKLREGKILDGRHRYRICMDLNIGVMCEELGTVDYATALSIVVSNSLSKNTSSDAAKTEAYLLCKASGIPNNKMPETFSRLNINYVRKLRFIEKINPEYLKVLLNQNRVRLYSMEFNKVEDYGTINGLWRTLKGNQKYADEVVEVPPEPVASKTYSVDLCEYFGNAVAEKEYWELYGMAKESGTEMHPDTALGRRIAGLIKHKYE